jgi:hypothetical protein
MLVPLLLDGWLDDAITLLEAVGCTSSRVPILDFDSDMDLSFSSCSAGRAVNLINQSLNEQTVHENESLQKLHWMIPTDNDTVVAGSVLLRLLSSQGHNKMAASTDSIIATLTKPISFKAPSMLPARRLSFSNIILSALKCR